MTSEQFNEFCKKLDQDCYKVLNQANQEYASDEEKFSNFQRLANSLSRNINLQHITPVDVACVYLCKHIDSIVSGISIRENMYNRIIDCINYLKLIAGMMEEQKLKNNKSREERNLL